jgi:peptide/nickel transport system ATP-binding protein
LAQPQAGASDRPGVKKPSAGDGACNVAACNPTVALLDVHDLRVSFPLANREAFAVDGVSLRLDEGQTVGLVGESGCGKTMTALAIIRLVPPPGRINGGKVLFAGSDLLRLSEREMRARRGKDIAMVFQEPMAALNPVLTIGSQIAEAVQRHQRLDRRAARAAAIEMLRLVEIPDAERRAGDHSHQLSGGMRQRVMIAMALSCRPRVLIADEPTTALDVTIQAQILDLLTQLRARFGMALLLVTHDLGVVAERADAVAVMYAGRIVEHGSVAAVFRRPLHPYTRALLESVPQLGLLQRRLTTIPGAVPSLLAVPSGCRFRDRCPAAVAACADNEPALREHEPGHLAACDRL